MILNCLKSTFFTNVAVDKVFGLQVAEGGGKLVAVEHQGGQVQLVLVVLEVGPQLTVLGQLHHDPDGGGALCLPALLLDQALVPELGPGDWRQREELRSLRKQTDSDQPNSGPSKNIQPRVLT